ncbi:hypothetical protein SLE2022_134730 [Rubroshorea leprosula]
MGKHRESCVIRRHWNQDTFRNIYGKRRDEGKEHSEPSKSAKRQEKKAQQEAAREQRNQDEQSNIVSERMIEDEKLVKKLEPLGLTISEIKPDGHSLYRAVEDQLTLLSGGSFFIHTKSCVKWLLLI